VNYVTPVDSYMIEVANQVLKNWEFSEKIGSDLTHVTSIVFKIMPSGEITDIFFSDKSGNSALDDSAYLAIQKTNPTKPIPKNIKKP